MVGLLSLLSATSPVRAEPKTYVVVPARSQVMFEASFPLGNFRGTAEEVRGEFQADLENIPAGIRGSVTVNLASLKTGIDRRDQDMRTTLEVEKHPNIRFTVREVREIGRASCRERVYVLV